MFPEGTSLHREGEMLSQSICPARAGVRGPQEVGGQIREVALLPSATRWQQRAPCLPLSGPQFWKRGIRLEQSSSPSPEGLLHPPTSQLTATVCSPEGGRRGHPEPRSLDICLCLACQHPCSHKLSSPQSSEQRIPDALRMLGSGDGAHPGWTTDFYSSHQVVTSTYTSLQVASLLPAPRSSPGTLSPSGPLHPHSPSPLPFGTRPHSLSKPCLLPPGSLPPLGSLPQPGKGLAWFGRGLGKGAPPYLCGRLGVSHRSKVSSGGEGGKWGEDKSLERKSGQRGVGW